MGIKFPERKEVIPKKVCEAITYIHNALFGEQKPVDFDLTYLITLMEYLGAEEFYPEGTVLRFIIPGCSAITRHYKTKKKGKFTCPINYVRGNREFPNSFQANNDHSLSFKEFIRLLHDMCQQ